MSRRHQTSEFSEQYIPLLSTDHCRLFLLIEKKKFEVVKTKADKCFLGGLFLGIFFRPNPPKVGLASLFYVESITAIAVNPLKRKFAKPTSVQ